VGHCSIAELKEGKKGRRKGRPATFLSAILQFCNPAMSKEEPRDRRRHEVGQCAGEHRAEAEARQIVARFGASAPMPPIWIPSS
jgi:hypothetical protein